MKEVLKRKIKNFVDDPRRSIRNARSRWLGSWRQWTSTVNPEPILVLGNQKSGTSAITALLGEATGLSYTIDVFCFFGDAEQRLLAGDMDFETFVEKARFRFSRDIVKEPSFIAFYKELASRFPDARFVFVVRHPVANIRSILDRLGLPGDRTCLSASHWKQVAEESQNWKMILRGRQYGHEGDTYIQTLARRWKMSARLYLSNSDRFKKITYEAFTQDKEGRIYELARRLGLDVSNDISDKVDVQYQPKGQKTVDPQSFFGERNLEKISEVCQPEMKSLGYESLISTRTRS